MYDDNLHIKSCIVMFLKDDLYRAKTGTLLGTFYPRILKKLTETIFLHGLTMPLCMVLIVSPVTQDRRCHPFWGD